MFSKKDIRNDHTVQEFLDERNIKKRTIELYISSLTKYANYNQMPISELLEEAEDEQDTGIKRKKRKIRKRMHGFVKHLLEEKKAANTINKYLTDVRTFYNNAEVDLPRMNISYQDEEELITIKDIPTKDDIRKALKYANIEYKAIILLMMSSGMGSAEIRDLKIRTYLDAQNIEATDFNNNILTLIHEKEKNIPIWSIRRIKTGMPYVTYSSPESNRAINEYLEDRLIKRDIELDDYLFETEGNKISKDTFSKYFARINDTAGLGKYKKQRFFRSHHLRKYFASTLHNNGMDYLDAEWLIGHSVKNTTDIYIKPDIYRLKKEYMDILPVLCLEDMETVTIESPEFQELKEMYERDAKVKDEEMARMNKRIELMEKLMSNEEYKKDSVK